MIKKLLYILLITGLFASAAFSDSVFSRSGWGFYRLNQVGREAGMGVMGIGSADTSNVGALNPALWAGINMSMFSSGAVLTRFSSKDENISDLSDEYLLQYVALGISFKPGLTFGLRFVPETRLDYRIVNTKTLPSDNTYKYEEIYLGKGGISLATALFAYRITPKYWVGAGADVVFGNILTLWRVNFIEGGGAVGSYTIYDPLDNEFKLTDKTIGVRPRIGFYGQLSDNSSIGIFAATSLDMTVTEELDYWDSDSTTSTEKNMNFPATAGVGYYFPIVGKIHGEFDYLWTGWTKNNQEVFNPDGFTESHFFGLGFEIDPEKELYLPFAKKITYRAGINYRNLYYQVPAGKDVNEYSLNFGAGLPIKSGKGNIDLNFTIGKRGDLGDNGAEEMFFGLGFYITAGEKWFVRKKRY